MRLTYKDWCCKVDKRIILETERLVLREYTNEDFDWLYEILSDEETMKHYPKPYDAAGVQRWLDWSLDNYQKHGFGLWVIELKDSGVPIGDAGITMQPIDGEWLPEVGYHVHKDYWRSETALPSGLPAPQRSERSGPCLQPYQPSWNEGFS